MTRMAAAAISSSRVRAYRSHKQGHLHETYASDKGNEEKYSKQFRLPHRRLLPTMQFFLQPSKTLWLNSTKRSRFISFYCNELARRP